MSNVSKVSKRTSLMNKNLINVLKVIGVIAGIFVVGYFCFTAGQVGK